MLCLFKLFTHFPVPKAKYTHTQRAIKKIVQSACVRERDGERGKERERETAADQSHFAVCICMTRAAQKSTRRAKNTEGKNRGKSEGKM